MLKHKVLTNAVQILIFNNSLALQSEDDVVDTEI